MVSKSKNKMQGCKIALKVMMLNVQINLMPQGRIQDVSRRRRVGVGGWEGGG